MLKCPDARGIPSRLSSKTALVVSHATGSMRPMLQREHLLSILMKRCPYACVSTDMNGWGAIFSGDQEVESEQEIVGGRAARRAGAWHFSIWRCKAGISLRVGVRMGQGIQTKEQVDETIRLAKLANLNALLIEVRKPATRATNRPSSFARTTSPTRISTPSRM